ncbi:auxin response factor 3-like isoform X1 [Citrus sinensis]|uniref:auxin response factor 3-like isoform X1 n=1 Tax=Citrus sinensis TaxID=2711 RepID=UPI0003D70D46|nr:auxin response factor 3-like isoform X1 [Citrus sinensis]
METIDAPSETETDDLNSTEISDEDDCEGEIETDDLIFTEISDKDDDYNLLLWQAFAGPPPSLPKKGDLVVYFPQGHLEYSAPASVSKAPPTFDLKPEIICRVADVRYLVSKKTDKVYTKMTLLPLPEMVGENFKGKELQDLVVDNKRDGEGSTANSTPPLFYKKLRASDQSKKKIVIRAKDAENVFPFLAHLDYKKQINYSVIAKDVHGVAWKFNFVDGKSRRHYLTVGWKYFVRQKNLVPGDTVIFIRDENNKLRLGIKRSIQAVNDVPGSIIQKHNTYLDVLSPVADAISNKSTFDVFYSPRARHSEFVICYQKYMKSIRKPVCIGEKIQMQYEMDDSSGKRCSGVVIGACDLDPNRWPNSKWRCLLVRWEEYIGSNCEEMVSPWEIDCSLSLPSMLHSSPRLKRPRTSLQDNLPAYSTTAGLEFPESSITSEGEGTASLINAIDLNRPFDLEPQAPVPKNFLALALFPDEDKILGIRTGETLESLEIDNLSSLASFLRSELAATTVKQLKINKCPDLEVLLHRMAYTSLEYLEFSSCLFFSNSKQDYFPTTLKRLKICDCTNAELILKVLMDQKGLALESLEVDGCSSLFSLPINQLPATLRHLRIVNCMNLKSLGESSKIRNCDSVVGPEGESSLENMTSSHTLELRELEIWDCLELEFLPEDMHNFTDLNLLSISNCPSLESFPEGGLPNTSLTSLLISECENLMSLPHQIHKATSLQDLSVSGCPSLMSFPHGGLPPNLISLGIIDCENLIPLSQWELHKLKHLNKYTILGGLPVLEE